MHTKQISEENSYLYYIKYIICLLSIQHERRPKVWVAGTGIPDQAEFGVPERCRQGNSIFQMEFIEMGHQLRGGNIIDFPE